MRDRASGRDGERKSHRPFLVEYHDKDFWSLFTDQFSVSVIARWLGLRSWLLAWIVEGKGWIEIGEG